MNGKGDEHNIAEETQRRILEIAKKLNYKANFAARCLSTGRTHTIGLVVPDVSNPFFANIVRKIEYYAEQKGYSVLITNTDENVKKEKEILKALINRQVEGIIIAPTEAISQNFDQIPIVVFDRIHPSQKTNFVNINNQETAFALTDHLFKQGHKKVALLSLTSFLPNIKERIEGYKQACLQNHVEIDNNLIIEIKNHNKKEDLKKALKSLFFSKTPVTAVLFLNNVLAAKSIWIINTCFKALSKDLSLASFDNLDIFDYTEPKITSALQPSEMISKCCVELLYELVEHDRSEPGIFFKTQLIIR